MASLSSPIISNDVAVRPQSMTVTGKVYASNTPRILLETLSSRTTKFVLYATYIAFAIGFAIDTLTTFESFGSSNQSLSALNCRGPGFPFNNTGSHNMGCTSGSGWSGIVKNIKNVLSVQLDVQRNNFTMYDTTSLYSKVVFDVTLWACYYDNGCGNSFGSSAGQWMKVLSYENQTVSQKVTSKFELLDVGIFPNTFQNQEAVPSNGIVKSYLVSVNYIYDQNNFFSNSDNTNLASVSYLLDLVCRPGEIWKSSVTVVLLAVTIAVVVGYVYVLRSHSIATKSKILSEQWWILFYCFAVIMYQNPVNLVVTFSKSTDSKAAFAAYFFEQFAQALLFVLWLAIAAAIFRKVQGRFEFYWAKILLGSTIFAFGLAILVLQFPSLDTTQSNRTAVQAVSSWTAGVKMGFCVCSIFFLVLQWVWTGTWFVNLKSSLSLLNKLPYMNTRYLQLSHRFFIFQAFAVTLYYIGQYIIVIVFIAKRAASSKASLTTLTDNVNTLFREQTLLFGKTFFLTCYAIILAFLYLPANFMEGNTLALSISSCTYVVSEDELITEREHRREVQKQIKKNLLTNNLLVNNFVKVETDIFCVDIALRMRDMSFQAYYDPKPMKTLSSFEGDMDLHSVGFEFVDAYYDPSHESFCIISRDVSSRRLVICFRGTASKRQMEDNLNYTKRELNIFSLKLTALDIIDGLKFDGNLITDETTLINFLYGSEEDTAEEENRDSVSNSSAFEYSRESTSHTFRETFVERAHQVENTVKKATHTVVDATQQVVGATTEIVKNAAASAPVLKQLLRPHVHSGFWSAYEGIRGFVHAVVRRELRDHPVDLFFTGHSLGGALATFAILDVCVHTLPRLHSHYMAKNALSPNPKSFPKSCTIRTSLYNFGSPRVGNRGFAQMFDRMIRSSFRVVVDGDLVTGLPPAGYKHIRTSVLIDGGGSGSIILDPSLVEKRLRAHSRASVAAHSLIVYKRGLMGIKMATEYMKAYAHNFDVSGEIDTIKLAVYAGSLTYGKQSDLDLEHIEVNDELGKAIGNGDIIASTKDMTTMEEKHHNREIQSAQSLLQSVPSGVKARDDPYCDEEQTNNPLSHNVDV